MADGGAPAERGAVARAVHEGRGNAARIRWRDEAARARGVRPGQTLAAARARCAELESALLDEALLREARRQALTMALEHTPRAAVGGPARLWVEPCPFGEAPEVWGEAIAEALRWADARVGIAAWASAAHAAALVAARCRVVDDALAFLDRAPLDALELDARAKERLATIGVRRVGELRRLDPKELGARFGPEVARAWRRAHGDDPRMPWTPPPERTPAVELSFDEIPLERVEPLLFVLRGALARLVRAPRGRGEGIVELALTLRTERPPPIEQVVRSAHPVADERTLLRLLQARLERPRPTSARADFVHGLRLEARELAPVPDPTIDAFREATRDPVAQQVALARLSGRFGEEALARASRVEAAHPVARARWSRSDPVSTGLARPWRGQVPPSILRDGRVEVGGRRRRVLRRGRAERAIAPWWSTGAVVVEQLTWVEVEGPLLVLLRRRGREGVWEAVAWID